MTNRVLHPAYRVAWVALLSLSPLLSCAPPHVQFDVELGAYAEDRESLQIELSLYVPSAGEEYTCEALAFGEVSDLDMRAARIHHEIIQSRTTSALRVPEMPRDGHKIALVMARKVDSENVAEVSLADALAVACTEFDYIESDERITLSLMPTLEVLLADPDPKFFVAQEGDDGAAPLHTSYFAADGNATEREGLLVELRGTRADGSQFAHPGRLRTRVLDAAKGITEKAFESEQATHVVDLKIPRAGPAEVEIRASFQKRAAPRRIHVLSTRVLMDTEAAATLPPGADGFRDGLQQSNWVQIGPVPGQSADSPYAFVLGSGDARNNRALVYGVPAMTGGDLTSLAQDESFLNAGPEGGEIQFLGFMADPTKANRIVLQVPPHREGNALVAATLLDSDGTSTSEYELPDFMENGPRQLAVGTGPLVNVSPCPGTPGGAGWLQGLNLGTAQDLKGQLDYLMILGRGAPPLASSDLLPGVSSRISGATCVDDTDGNAHRLLFTIVNSAPLFERVVDLGTQGWLVEDDGVIQGSPWLRLRTGNSRVAASISGRNQIIFPELHNDDLEFNAYLVQTAQEACAADASDASTKCFQGFEFQKTWVSMAHELNNIRQLLTISGRFQAADHEQMLIAIEREGAAGQIYVELFWRSLSENQDRPVWAQTLLNTGRLGESSWQATDLNGDGIDELMLVDQSGAAGARRARIIAF